MRGPQTFIAPIHLSHEILPSAIFYGTIAPLALFYVVKKLIIDPYVKEKEETEAKRKQEKLKTEIVERRRLALAAQDLMKETLTRILEREGPNGLIITKAIYGKISNTDTTILDDSKCIDVRIPLQFLVQDNSLQILADESKSNLEGFYDPCFGEKNKSLYIEYKFKGEEHRVTYSDTALVRLPKTSHKSQWWSRSFSSVKVN
jgi:DnaJ homolog subfamily C member 11